MFLFLSLFSLINAIFFLLEWMTDENMQEHCQLTVGQTSPNPPAPEEQTSGSVTLCQSANKKGEMRERAGKRRIPFNER